MSATDNLSMIDEFGARKEIIPAEVSGRLRTWRTAVHVVLLVFLLILPWVKINGLQAVLLDIPGRRFEIFGVLFLAHDAPLLFFILMLMVLSLAIVTALWGRVWCGWACPQTVFIDSVYRRIEIWTVGNYIERRRLAAQPMDFTKLRKYALKWFLFFAFSSLLAHSLIAYFAGSSRLIAMIQGPPGENWSYFVAVTFVTGVLLFNFGWFREQFCLIMCPYGRFQSVLMDAKTKAILYDEKRGEPRKGKELAGAARGDCVSCNRCVQVCPTGIDIRNGLQMECISCTACIDACNEIMRKVKKPEGLIRYQQISGGVSTRVRPRLIAYGSLALILVVSLTSLLAIRKPYSMAILRATDVPYQILPEGKVLNHFKAHFVNQSSGTQEFAIELPTAEQDGGVVLTQAQSVNSLSAGASFQGHFFVTFPQERLGPDGKIVLHIRVNEQKSGQHQIFEVTAVGPNQVMGKPTGATQDSSN